VELELIASATNIGKHDKFHPTMAMLGEVLPSGFSRSNMGFLLDNNILMVEVNQTLVRKKTKYLIKHAIVAYFVERRPTQEPIALWIRSLQTEVGDWVGLGRDLGRSFFQVLCKHKSVMQKLLMRTSYRLR